MESLTGWGRGSRAMEPPGRDWLLSESGALDEELKRHRAVGLEVRKCDRVQPGLERDLAPGLGRLGGLSDRPENIAVTYPKGGAVIGARGEGVHARARNAHVARVPEAEQLGRIARSERGPHHHSRLARRVVVRADIGAL